MEILLTKTPQGALIPATEDEGEKLRRFKVGATVRADVSQMRNYEHHKKWFALVKIAYDAWTETAPDREYKGVRVQPDFDRFRKDLIILCGRFKPVFAVNGEVRLEADSISFANMSQEEFEKLFSKTIDVILQKILSNGRFTESELRELVEQVIGFA